MKKVTIVTDRQEHLIAEYDELCHKRDRAGAIDLNTARRLQQLAWEIDKAFARRNRRVR